MPEALICNAVRASIGYRGALNSIRADDLAAVQLNALVERNPSVDWTAVDDLVLPEDASHVSPNGGAIAIGHPIGMSGARLVTTAMYQFRRTGGRYALCTMCIGVGQGIATIIERV